MPSALLNSTPKFPEGREPLDQPPGALENGFQFQATSRNATKEMTQAISGAPDQTKPFLQPLLKRLEAKDDINK